MTSPAEIPEIPLLRASALAPGITLHPAPGPDDGVIAGARRRRLRRATPPSPHLLCVGWRRRVVDPYAQTSTPFAPQSSQSVLAALGSIALALPALPALPLPPLSLDPLVDAAARLLALASKDILPLHAYTPKRRAPLALLALLLAISLALSIALHASLAGLGIGSRLAAHDLRDFRDPAPKPAYAFGSGSFVAAYEGYAGAHAHHARYAESRLAATHLRAVETARPRGVGIAMPRRKSGTVDPWGLQ